MKILFLLLKYEKNEKYMNLYKELVLEFKKNNNQVYVATINERKNKQSTVLSEENEISVLRIKTGNLFNVNLIEKGITTMSLGYIFKKNIEKYFKNIKFDAVVYHTPPITFIPVIKFLKKKYETKSYLILRDIFPQNARDLNILRNNLLFKYFRIKEQKLYEYSDYIGCMSQRNIDYILEKNKNVDSNKLHILKNWGAFKKEILIDREQIRNKYNIPLDKKIIVFGGNMGKPQGLDFILDLSNDKYISENKIFFIFIGNGSEKMRLKRRIEVEGLKNIKIFDFIPREDYEKFLKSCDIALVSLHKNFTIPNIPSKTVDYCKLGLPILACIDKNTDYGEIITKEAKCGVYSIYGNYNEFIKKLDYILSDKKIIEKFRKNAREYYEKELNVKIAYKTIIDKLNKKISNN